MPDLKFDIIVSLQTNVVEVTPTRSDIKSCTIAGNSGWPIIGATPSLASVSGPKKSKLSATMYTMRRTYVQYDTRNLTGIPEKIKITCSLRDESQTVPRGSRSISIYKIPDYNVTSWPDLSTCLLLKTFWTIPPPSSTLVMYSYSFYVLSNGIDMSDYTYLAMALTDEITEPYYNGPTESTFLGTFGSIKLYYPEEA